MANRSDIESKIYKIVGYQFNLLSNKQLIKALYEDAGIPVIEKTSAGNPSTTEATLKKLAEDYELAALVLEFKKEMKKSSGIKEETKKAPKPGMPQERQVLSRTNIVDELNRDPEDILQEEESKEQSRKNDSSGASATVSSSGAQSASQLFTLKPLPENKPASASEAADSSSSDPLMEGVFGTGGSGGAQHEVSQTPVTVSVAMEIPDDVDVGADSLADANNRQANSGEAKPEENVNDEEKKVVSFGMSSSFSLSKDQENVHNAIHEKDQGKSAPQRKKAYDLEDDEDQENEFSRNSATLNVKKRVVEDTRQEEKSKVGLVIMILVAVLAVVVVGIGVNSIMQIG